MYGKVIVGYSGGSMTEGGMNEKGLFWDYLATPYHIILNLEGKPYFKGYIFEYILNVCETCDDALKILNQYNLKPYNRVQVLVGDRYGDSFIIEGNIIHNKKEYFQVATNFLLSRWPNPPYPCWRYNTALKMFTNNPSEELSVDFCASVLDATHEEGQYPTQYSTVYDLKNGLVYLYHNHNFNSVKIFDLKEEFKLGYHYYSIPELFGQNSQSPNKPNEPTGPDSGKIRTKQLYYTYTTDPEKDELFYLWDWGDGTDSEWLGPYKSGVTCYASHTWKTKDNYNIKVKAKDIYGKESAWSDPLPITMPYLYNPMLRFLELLF
jgi:hypothetical protein